MYMFMVDCNISPLLTHISRVRPSNENVYILNIFFLRLRIVYIKKIIVYYRTMRPFNIAHTILFFFDFFHFFFFGVWKMWKTHYIYKIIIWWLSSFPAECFTKEMEYALKCISIKMWNVKHIHIWFASRCWDSNIF